MTDAAEAGFVIAAPETLPPLASLALGTEEAPHLSATVVLDVRGCAGHRPGSPHRAPASTAPPRSSAPWAPDGFADAWRGNTELFPRGVDLLLVDSEAVTALPRTTRLTTVDPEQED